MKNPLFLIILLAVALAVVSYLWIKSSNKTPAVTEKSTYEDIMTRTSVRSYTSDPVSKELVDTILRAAMAAPSAGNKQPWRFVVVDDRAILDFIADNYNTMTMARKAPLAVILCGDLTATFEGEGVEYWVEDVSASAENLLLAAHASGLGAVWCGIYPLSERVAGFSRLLKLPENIIPMACVCIGHPDGNPTPKDKWKPENIHYNTWDGSAPDLTVD